MSEPTLTIAIPTFERCETVLETVGSAVSSVVGLDVQVLVADNASQDETVKKLREHYGDACEVIAGTSNGGFIANFERLVDSCTTDYLLLISDEETVASGVSLQRLLYWLSAERPDFSVSGPNRKVEEDRGIRPDEFWDATNYLSGCIFKVEALRASRASVRDGLQNYRFDVLWELWPMYVVALHLAVGGGDCRYYPERLYTKRAHLPTRIRSDFFGSVDQRRIAAGRDPLRARYKTLEARLVQSSARAELLRFESSIAGDAAQVDRLRRFELEFERGLAPLVLNRIAKDYPELEQPLVRGLRRELSPWRRFSRRLVGALRTRSRRSPKTVPLVRPTRSPL